MIPRTTWIGVLLSGYRHKSNKYEVQTKFGIFFFYLQLTQDPIAKRALSHDGNGYANMYKQHAFCCMFFAYCVLLVIHHNLRQVQHDSLLLLHYEINFKD